MRRIWEERDKERYEYDQDIVHGKYFLIKKVCNRAVKMDQQVKALDAQTAGWSLVSVNPGERREPPPTQWHACTRTGTHHIHQHEIKQHSL